MLNITTGLSGLIVHNWWQFRTSMMCQLIKGMAHTSRGIATKLARTVMGPCSKLRVQKTTATLMPAPTPGRDKYDEDNYLNFVKEDLGE